MNINSTQTHQTLIFVLGIVFIFFSSTPTYSDSDQKSDINRDLRNGKIIVLIINSTKNQESEQYADWSYYLNNFAGSVSDKYSFHKLDTKSLMNLMKGANAYKKAYSMIFMKQKNSTYFYNGPILEPQVYEYIQLAYSKKTIPEYLNSFSPEKIIIQFRQCLDSE